uniref:PDZ domain-containing protein n=1 Tax=Strongyloides papillosus TaxID=174720 RepID=A0A0N5B6B4_STREA
MSSSSNLSSGSSNTNNKITFEVPVEDGEPLGGTPNENLIIVKIQKGTIGEKFLQVGDQIISVNNIPVKNTDHFYELLQYIDTKFYLTISRDDKRTNEMLSRIQIPEDREKNILRKDGYVYFLATLTVSKGRKLGIGIRHHNNKVIVSKCDQGSVSDEVFIPGDRICDVDGIPVSDKNVCKKLIINNLQKNNKVTVVVERPDSEDAIKFIDEILCQKNDNNPSYRMNSDVKQIAALERKRIKAYDKPAKSILSINPIQSSKGITFDDEVFEYFIVSDNEGKELRKVRK